MNEVPPSPSTVPAPSPAPGLLLVITGASGVGKGTLRAGWLKDQDVFYSTSWTTRPPREGERDGVDYVFVDRDTFTDHIGRGEFLEHAEFVGNHYGTPLAPIREALARGQDVVLEIEVEGARQVRRRLGNEAVMIFILPPSLEELRRRLEGRATETPERIEKRLARAEVEMNQTELFDYLVVNDDLEQAVADLHTIQQAERSRLVPAAQRTPEQQRQASSAEHLRTTRRVDQPTEAAGTSQ
ncbi:MAG: guanylate kinase [Deinococcus sp.]|nr:guanylate kinase [Deinococcus sp.]